MGSPSKFVGEYRSIFAHLFENIIQEEGDGVFKEMEILNEKDFNSVLHLVRG